MQFFNFAVFFIEEVSSLSIISNSGIMDNKSDHELNMYEATTKKNLS